MSRTPAASSTAAATANGAGNATPKKKRGGGVSPVRGNFHRLAPIGRSSASWLVTCQKRCHDLRSHRDHQLKLTENLPCLWATPLLAICYSDDLITWTPLQKIDAKLPKGWVGPWEPCVAVTDFSKANPDNVVLFMAGTLNGKGKWFYAISEMLIFQGRPDQESRSTGRLHHEAGAEPYESGQNKNCLWMNCIIAREGQWLMYYGAGDRYVALATYPVK